MNSPRPRALVRLVALSVVAVLLTACGSVHPGSAAIVDDESISMRTADKASAAYCKLALAVAKQQGVATVSAADTRRQSVTDLIMFKVATKIAKDQHLDIDPATYVITDKQGVQISQAFPHTDLQQIRAAIERSQHTYAITVALGQIALGQKLAADTQAAIEQAGTAVITKAYKKSDVSIDPRFGLNDLTKQIGQTGSLSVPQVTEDSDPAALPVSQRCS